MSVKKGGVAIIMQPDTGNILAMATCPEYNLNEPFTINNEELLASWESLSSNDKNTYLQKMWRNKAIVDTYEPGSTFKLITTSAALQEGIVTDTDKAGEFCCTGRNRYCWNIY